MQAFYSVHSGLVEIIFIKKIFLLFVTGELFHSKLVTFKISIGAPNWDKSHYGIKAVSNCTSPYCAPLLYDKTNKDSLTSEFYMREKPMVYHYKRS